MKILVIDGNNTAHRAKHVFSLSDKGIDVSVSFGFLRILYSLVKKFKPGMVIVCWDGGTPEFRRKLLPEYKANRHQVDDPTDYENFVRQMHQLDAILPYFGVMSVRKAGAEADDLISQTTSLLSTIGNEVIVISTDKDMLQLIRNGVRVYNPTKDYMYDDVRFVEEFGIDVIDFISWRALQGDGSDNIRGVEGIGEKTATKLFKQFGTLTGIVNAALGINPVGKLEGRIAKNIVEFGFDRIAHNIQVMALYADRVGARKALLEAPAVMFDRRQVKKFLLMNNFVSLMDDCMMFGNLSVIPFSNTKLRCPVVYGRTRRPI